MQMTNLGISPSLTCKRNHQKVLDKRAGFAPFKGSLNVKKGTLIIVE